MEKVKELTKKTNFIPKTFTKHSSNIPEETINEYKCSFCRNNYSSSSNLTRHKKICVEKKRIQNNYSSELEKRDLQLQQYEEKIKHLTEVNSMLKEENKKQEENNQHLKSLINNAGAVIKTSVSALSYVAQNYGDAPILKKLKDYSYLEEADNDDEFDLTKTLINRHKDKILIAYIGDIIVKAYKKDDPTQQSIWNSDSVRLTYVIRELIDKKPDWQVDKKGIKTNKYIVAPLLEYIRELMAEFMENNKLEDYLYESPGQMKKRMDNLQAAAEICFIIKNKTLSLQILKYIAPHFYLGKTELLIEN